MTETAETSRDLVARLDAGPVVCAEGYLFELERRGYVQAGPFVPIVVIEHPEVVLQLHRDFAHAGSDVMEAFTYYSHREKLKLIGKEHVLEELNRQALALAKQAADEYGCLFAGDICNTNIYEPNDHSTRDTARAMFEEQVGWAVDAGADFVIGETFSFVGEALIALEVVKEAGKRAVITLAVHRDGRPLDADTPEDACKQLEAAGADVVGLNCFQGPRTLMPLVRRIREAVSCHVAALPVPYRTTAEQPTFQSLRDGACDCIPGGMPFPTALDPFVCNRFEMAEFAKDCAAHDVRYVGVCCGAGPHHIRAVAEALGRYPPASRFSPDMSKHAFFGTDQAIPDAYKDRAKLL